MRPTRYFAESSDSPTDLLISDIARIAMMPLMAKLVIFELSWPSVFVLKTY